jgi:hypothetical protein
MRKFKIKSLFDDESNENEIRKSTKRICFSQIRRVIAILRRFLTS